MNRVDNTDELRQETIAHRLEDASTIFSNLGLNHIMMKITKAPEGFYLILFHSSAVTDYISGEYRS